MVGYHVARFIHVYPSSLGERGLGVGMFTKLTYIDDTPVSGMENL